jgi:hypothetical protein
MKNETARPPPGKKRGPASKQGHKLINLAESTSSDSPSQARSCLVETPQAIYVRMLRIVQAPATWLFWALEKRIAALDVEIERRQS